MNASCNNKIYYHLPGLFEFFDLYLIFVSIFKNHREYFYDWCEIGSIYGAPEECLWSGGRVEHSSVDSNDVFNFMRENDISARLTLSNSLLSETHLGDKNCNSLCCLFNDTDGVQNGAIIASDLLLDYLIKNTSNLYFVSSTTKVITDFSKLITELDNGKYKYVVPDFRFNKQLEKLNSLTTDQRNKIELLCNECCSPECRVRKECYDNVSRISLGLNYKEHICVSTESASGYVFSKAKKNPCFIGIDEIRNVYAPMGIYNFKIEGRGLGSAIVFEILLYYMVKPEYQLNVREETYLDNMLDLF